MKTIKVRFTSGGNRPDIGEFRRDEERPIPEPVAVELIGCGLAEQAQEPTIKEKKSSIVKGAETEAKTNG